MKTILKLLAVFLLLLTVSGCRTHQAVTNDVITNAEILYRQASKALNEHKFIIKASEFYLPEGKSRIKNSSGSYIAMQDNYAIIHFTPDVFPRSPFSYLTIEDNAATLTIGKTKKNGKQFILKVEGNQEWLRRKVLITLYNNTNECFVEIKDRAGATVVNLKGEVYPYEK